MWPLNLLSCHRAGDEVKPKARDELLAAHRDQFPGNAWVDLRESADYPSAKDVNAAPGLRERP